MVIAFSPLPHCPLRRRNPLAMWRGMDMGEALMAVIDPLVDHVMSDPLMGIPRLASRFAVPRWTLQDTPLETPCLCLEGANQEGMVEGPSPTWRSSCTRHPHQGEDAEK